MADSNEFEKAVSELKIKDIVITSIITGLGLLVALTWRDAIQLTINYVVPHGEGLLYSYLAAIIITVVSVGAGYLLIRVQRLNLEIARAIRDVNRNNEKVVKKSVRIQGRFD
ncbi:MAG: DUF5654 family protein [Candidatus Aenigmarchaeota archaeon]|nr:DUF5654 family protein [Candidatus Aenigmarchaeota archaeon]